MSVYSIMHILPMSVWVPPRISSFYPGPKNMPIGEPSTLSNTNYCRHYMPLGVNECECAWSIYRKPSRFCAVSVYDHH